jgi:hypothetical protein
MAAPVPDSDNTRTVCCVNTGTFTFSGATATSGVIALLGLHGTANVATCEVAYGNDATDRTQAPTASTVSVSPTEVLMYAMFYQPVRYRMTAAQLTVNLISAPDTAAGYLQPCDALVNTRTAAATWNTYAQSTDRKIGQEYPVTVGCKINRLVTADSFAWITTIPLNYNGATACAYGPMPRVQFVGLSATTTLKIDYVVHYELALTTVSPIAATPSVIEPELNMLIGVISRLPRTAGGHSFKDFLKSLSKGIGKGLKFVWNNRDEILGVARDIAELASV